MKEAGFSAVELAPRPPCLAPERLAEILARHDLAVVSIHGDLPTASNIARWERIARECRCAKVIWHGWPRDVRFDSLAGLQDLAAACNAAGVLARDRGLRFGVHNHWWEFEPVEGERPIRLLHESLALDIFWQLDVYWARTGGADPVDVVSELGPRVGSLHLKDGPAVHGEPMTALGRGVLDIPRILQAVPRPVDFVIELDECDSDPLEAARESLAYLESRRDHPRQRPPPFCVQPGRREETSRHGTTYAPRDGTGPGERIPVARGLPRGQWDVAAEVLERTAATGRSGGPVPAVDRRAPAPPADRRRADVGSIDSAGSRLTRRLLDRRATGAPIAIAAID